MIEQNHQIKTERCILRHVSKEDIPQVFDATRVKGFNDGMVWDPPANPQELLQPFKDNCEAWRTGTAYVFTIETHDGAFIGRISIRSTKSKGLWSLGFWTHPRFQGMGYMSESVRGILEFGFNRLSAKEIEACHASWNVASQRVLEKCGFTWREHIEQGFKKKGDWVAEDRLSIKR